LEAKRVKEEENRNIVQNGPLITFCETEEKKFGMKWKTPFNKYKTPYAMHNITWKYGDETDEAVLVPLCKQYYEDRRMIFVMDESIKYLIIVINTVIRMLVIMIIDRVGCDTQSREMAFVTIAVFLCTFFNTGFLLMIVNANMEK
jgi:hypothetical protein